MKDRIAGIITFSLIIGCVWWTMTQLPGMVKVEQRLACTGCHHNEQWGKHIGGEPMPSEHSCGCHRTLKGGKLNNSPARG